MTHTFTPAQSSRLRAILGLPADADGPAVYSAACAQLDARAEAATTQPRSRSDADSLYASVFPTTA